MSLVLPTENLTRTVLGRVQRSTDDNGDGLSLEGYGAVFGERTRIDSWEGFFDEEIAHGAFAKTLKNRTPVIQFDHGAHPFVGSIPIAAPTAISEDNRGLLVKARCHDNDLVKPVRDAIESGAISGMSIRFRVVKETIDESGDVPLRIITELVLYETGPVVFPAYEGTTVGVRSSDLRSLLADPKTRAELAQLLGTPTPGAAGRGQELPKHSGPTTEARSRILDLIQSQED